MCEKYCSLFTDHLNQWKSVFDVHLTKCIAFAYNYLVLKIIQYLKMGFITYWLYRFPTSDCCWWHFYFSIKSCPVCVNNACNENSINGQQCCRTSKLAWYFVFMAKFTHCNCENAHEFANYYSQYNKDLCFDMNTHTHTRKKLIISSNVYWSLSIRLNKLIEVLSGVSIPWWGQHATMPKRLPNKCIIFMINRKPQ